MNIGFIGLGNVGDKLAGSLLRNGMPLSVRDLSRETAQPFLDAGAHWADSPAQMMRNVDVAITCLPTPQASAAVLEADDGLLSGMAPGKIWMEMSTTDESEVRRLGAMVRERGGEPVDCPVSGGCHRADTGNIAIFAGCERATFERVLPLLTTMDLVSKDIGLFQAVAERAGVKLELNPVMIDIFKDGEARYGAREWSPNIIRRLEDDTGLSILASGFPAQMVDDEPEEPGYEVVPKGRR